MNKFIIGAVIGAVVAIAGHYSVMNMLDARIKSKTTKQA